MRNIPHPTNSTARRAYERLCGTPECQAYQLADDRLSEAIAQSVIATREHDEALLTLRQTPAYLEYAKVEILAERVAASR